MRSILGHYRFFMVHKVYIFIKCYLNPYLLCEHKSIILQSHTPDKMHKSLATPSITPNIASIVKIFDSSPIPYQSNSSYCPSNTGKDVRLPPIADMNPYTAKIQKATASPG